MTIDIEELKKEIDAIYSYIVNIRRTLHKYPELSERENKTEQLIGKILKEQGIQFESAIAGHGVVALLESKNSNHCVGIRADIDALPIEEKTDLPFKSTANGVMHACGHDMHAAILLGTGVILKKHENELPGSVKLFFQPSEETIGGAKQMIDAGCLKNPDVKSVIGLHVSSALSAGQLEFIRGSMNAASCEFTIIIKGQSCHGAHPNTGVDSLLPACTIVSSIQSIITRSLDPTDSAVITVGTFNSGTKANIISGETTLKGIIRTLNLDNRDFIKSKLKNMCNCIAESYGCTSRIIFKDSYPSLENDAHLLELVSNTAIQALGKENIFIRSTPSLGADDFSYFCHDARGLYFNLGTLKADCSNNYPIHNEFFNPDEVAIKTGILAEVISAIEILEDEVNGEK